MVVATYPSENLMKHSNDFQSEKKKSNNCTTSDDYFAYTNIQNQINQQYDPVKAPPNIQSYTYLASKSEELPSHTLVFNVEDTLLKSGSWFPFFMLVAFEGGGLLRALVLLILYPLLCLVNQEWKLKLMVFVCFFGVKRSNFRIGRTVLPKFFLENVGHEGFDLIMRFGKRVAVTNLPRIMVEGFLTDYFGIDTIFGREIKVFEGYYVGLMESKEVTEKAFNKLVSKKEIIKSQVIGMVGSAINDKDVVNICEELYLVSKDDKEKWHYLPRDKYPKPLIFHDGRLAFLPTPLASMVMIIWLPFGIILCIIRVIVAQILPYKVSIPILAFLGTSALISRSNHSQTSGSWTTNEGNHNPNKSKGILYVCNHKTLFDPVYISFASGAPLTALTYSISKTTPYLAPIKTITLTRNREKDAEIMRQRLSKESIVVCPEGTTCREPYLLRFSPLFAEISDNIVPVAMEVEVSMFYGTTASGLKALDPIIFLMNPYPYYYINFLEALPKSHTCGAGNMSKIDVANYVQGQLGKATGYKCTDLTRKDKYIILAGNTGV